MTAHYYILSFIGLMAILYLINYGQKNKLPPFSRKLVFLLLIYVVLLITFFPSDIYSDKFVYLEFFNSIRPDNLRISNDFGWNYYTYFLKNITDSSTVYFLITSICYVSGYFIFAKKIIPSSYHFIFLFASIMSMGFFAYGVNTIRAGFAISIFLIALANYKKIIVFLLLGLLSVSFHKSMALPMIAFILSEFFNKPKWYLSLWSCCLIISIFDVSIIQRFVTSGFIDLDQSRSGYFDLKAETYYRTGFRIDFVIYSIVPIIVGMYYILKSGLDDIFYSRLLSTYLIVNAIWLLVIRMNFTDRFAYLSWFLMPFILLYPPLKYQLPINQRKFVTLILTGIILFAIFMALV